MLNQAKDSNETKAMQTAGEWIIVRDAGLWLVGMPVYERIPILEDQPILMGLSPVFELTVNVQPQVDPRTGRPSGVVVNDHAQPMLLMGSMTRSWKLSPGANVWPVRGNSREQSIRAAIVRAEEMTRQMRAQDSGLTIAREIPKIGRIQ